MPGAAWLRTLALSGLTAACSPRPPKATRPRSITPPRSAPLWLSKTDPSLQPVTGLYGRQELVEEILSKLESVAFPTVNVTGAPGIGQTEVAKAVVLRWLANAEHRALMANLRGADTVK